MIFINEPMPILQKLDEVLFEKPPTCLPICYCWSYCGNYGCSGGYNPQ